MASTQAPAERKRSALRTWFPLVALALGAVAVAGVWLWPADDAARLYRVLGTYAAGGLVALVLLLWLLFFAPVPRATRLGILAGVAGVGAVLAALFTIDDRGFW